MLSKNLTYINLTSNQMSLSFKLIGNWEWWTSYPVSIAESLGAMIGKDFVVVSGYAKRWNETTKKVYAFDTTMPKAKWREMDEVPTAEGFSHAAFAVDGDIMYVCGGYVGATPGPHTDTCLRYNHSSPPTTQWTYMPPLPEGRGGGGMILVNNTKTLMYATGATRVDGAAYDHRDVWGLNLNNLTSGWKKFPDIPYEGNHVSHVTASFKGQQRHFIMGGQLKQNEKFTNQAHNFEWNSTSMSWTRRASLPVGRGHASSSTFPYGCGLIIAGGAINNNTKTKDVSFYSIETDSWTKIGDLVIEMNTPVCDIVRFSSNSTDYIYCQTGGISTKFSWRIQISLS
jgi:N-acetylneuraminic acid mutarotase